MFRFLPPSVRPSAAHSTHSISSLVKTFFADRGAPGNNPLAWGGMRLIISSGPPEFKPSPPHGRRTYWKSMSIIMKTYCYPGAFCMEHRTNNLTTVSNKSDTLYDTWTDRTAHHRLPKLWLGNKGAFRALFALIFISETENKQNKPPKNIRQFENEVSENRKKNIKPSHGKFLFDKKCRRFQLPRHVKRSRFHGLLNRKIFVASIMT